MKTITEEQLLEQHNEAAIEWAKQQNAVTQSTFMQSNFFRQVKSDTLEILQAQDKIPYISFRGPYVYNLWEDGDHHRGLIRRTTLKEYLNDHPTWENVLDIDALAAKEEKPWVFKGITWLQPDFERALVQLSNGGGDTVEIREFDARTKQFLSDGFYLPPAKSDVVWVNQDTLLVGTEVGEDSLTTSGYPRTVRLLKRGQSLQDAPVLFSARKEDVSADIWSSTRPDGQIYIFQRAIDFFNLQYFIWDPARPMEHQMIPVPTHVEILDVFQGELIIRPRERWQLDKQVLQPGSVWSMSPFDLTSLKEIYSPKARHRLDSVSAIHSKLILKITDPNLNSQIFEAVKTAKGWLKASVDFPNIGTMDVVTASDFRDDYMVVHQGPLNPTKLYYAVPTQTEPKLIKGMTDKFESGQMLAEQFQVQSRDGTLIPYTVLRTKDMPCDGTTPTILYGYGGFEVSLEPAYRASVGKNWVEKGGCFVIANIRGGGEFGPAWHQAALKENRQVAYDDFIAVAEDLIARGITSPKHLGIQGASNGGLLVGAVFVQRPDLFAAVDCGVPLLRMLDYHKLSSGAGSSWVGEYGDPDDTKHPEIRAAIEKYSPYDNVSAKKTYPEVFFNSSLHDDRVHPGHARCMVHKMQNQGHTVYYFETLEEGGHGYANLVQRAEQIGLGYSYFAKKLGLKPKPELKQQFGQTMEWSGTINGKRTSELDSQWIEDLVKEGDNLDSPESKRRRFT